MEIGTRAYPDGNSLALKRPVILLSGATPAEHFVFTAHFAAEVDTFAANIAHNSITFITGEFFWR